MADSAAAIERFLAGKSRPDLERDEVLRAAVLHHLVIIGEAASRVSSLTRDKAPSIPWKAIASTRNHLVHGYFSVDWDIVWPTASAEIQDLRIQIEALLK